MTKYIDADIFVTHCCNSCIKNGVSCCPTVDSCDYIEDLQAFLVDAPSAADRLEAQEQTIAALTARAEQERQWISVKDRLPDMCGCKCLVVGTNRFGQVDVFTAFTGYMEREKLEFHSCEPTHEIPAWTVTHWMPLPKPPAHCGRLLTEGSAE